MDQLRNWLGNAMVVTVIVVAAVVLLAAAVWWFAWHPNYGTGSTTFTHN